MEKIFNYLINNRTISSTEQRDVRNPFTKAVVGQIYWPDRSDIDNAVEGSLKAQIECARMSSFRKETILKKIEAEIAGKSDIFIKLIVGETGKTISDARFEVERAGRTFHLAAEESQHLGGEVVEMDTWEKTENKFGIIRRAPVGTVAAVISYHFPLNFAARKIATAIAAGCPCILIPSQKSMLTASLLGEIISEVQMPEGSVSIFPCDTFELEEVLTDPRIKIFSYTGDVDTGWHLRSKAKNKKAILETGGIAIAIVDEKSDLELAAQKCVRGAFTDSGQMYLSLQTILVHTEVYAQFVSEMMKQIQSIRVGDPDHEKTDVGPLIDEETADETMALIDEAISKGAKLLAGGKRDGNLVYPTILVKTTPEMKISSQICFGPVVSISTFSKIGEAIHFINNIQFAVQVGIFSKEVDRIFTFFNSFDIGSMIVNDIPTFRADHVPYGGFKRFGLGKEGVRYNIEALMENKILILNFDQVKDWKGIPDE